MLPSGLEEIPIAYEMQGEGVPLVFIHQVATDGRLWHHQMAYFQSRYRLITVDLFGHGKVAWPRHQVSVEHAARGIERLLERLGVGPVFLIGVSLGAAVAVRSALDNPNTVQGLVLVSPWIRAGEDLQALVDRFSSLAEGERVAAHADLFLRYVLPPAYQETHPQQVEWLRTLALEQSAAAVAEAWAAWRIVDFRGELEALRVPTLVIAGMHDLFTPPHLARGMAEALSEVELEVWEETGHFPFLEDPVRFNRRLEAFVLRCLGKAT